MRHAIDGQPDLARFDGTLQSLDLAEAQGETGQRSFAAAWRTPERHISTSQVARAVRASVADRDIGVALGRITGVADDGAQGWQIALADGSTLRARAVVNALWENRAVMDRDVAPETVSEHVSIRYRFGLFGSNAGLQGLTPSTRILGKFGDVALFPNGDAQLSWYPAGLSARTDSGIPPAVPSLDSALVTEQTLAGLGLPAGTLAAPGSTWQINGGFVVAAGGGDIDQQISPLHARDRIGVRHLRPGFVSVDTGKYTMGPLFAHRAASVVEERLRELGYRAPSLAASA
jgi:hypothetical protein